MMVKMETVDFMGRVGGDVCMIVIHWFGLVFRKKGVKYTIGFERIMSSGWLSTAPVLPPNYPRLTTTHPKMISILYLRCSHQYSVNKG